MLERRCKESVPHMLKHCTCVVLSCACLVLSCACLLSIPWLPQQYTLKVNFCLCPLRPLALAHIQLLSSTCPCSNIVERILCLAYLLKTTQAWLQLPYAKCCNTNLCSNKKLMEQVRQTGKLKKGCSGNQPERHKRTT